jgi:dolichyl-phosphate beta-glucosyltransferase
MHDGGLDRREEKGTEVKDPTRNSEVDVSVVIPAYNEGEHIFRTLRGVDDYLAGKWPRYEIIVVDDGSRDKTVAEVERAAERGKVRLLKNQRNRGKGYSVRRGMLASRGRYVLFSDADLSTPIAELDRLLREARRGHDVVIGSRALRNSHIDVHQPFYRELMGKVFNLILRSLGLSRFRDTQCGFKLFSRKAVQAIFPLIRIQRFAFDVEILLIAERLGFKVKQVPGHWRESLPSKVSLFRDSTRMFLDVIRVRLAGRRYGREKQGPRGKHM